MRYFLSLAYKGTNYHGWQIQANAHSIQAEIEKVFSTVLRQKIEITGSSRTDTGVHAEQQFAHFDTDVLLNKYEHLNRFNALLPKDISIHKIFKSNSSVHSRFDAIQRAYEYRISQVKNPFLIGLSYQNTYPYQIDKMNQAAKLLLKYNDFECFSKVHTQVKHFICHISEAYWLQKEDLLVFYISSNRFLRAMVRTIVGTMLLIGCDKMELSDFEQIILSKDRKNAGFAVPPEGLFLTKVVYPFELIEID